MKRNREPKQFNTSLENTERFTFLPKFSVHYTLAHLRRVLNILTAEKFKCKLTSTKKWAPCSWDREPEGRVAGQSRFRVKGRLHIVSPPVESCCFLGHFTGHFFLKLAVQVKCVLLSNSATYPPSARSVMIHDLPKALLVIHSFKIFLQRFVFDEFKLRTIHLHSVKHFEKKYFYCLLQPSCMSFVKIIKFIHLWK